eukprot:3461156-Pleurochrysis_carterae.AAC.4
MRARRGQTRAMRQERAEAVVSGEDSLSTIDRDVQPSHVRMLCTRRLVDVASPAVVPYLARGACGCQRLMQQPVAAAIDDSGAFCGSRPT